MTAVAMRLASICNMIQEHRAAGKAISARRAAVISAMIDDVAATAAEGRPRACRRKRRMASAHGYKQEGRRSGQGERGIAVRARHRATGHVVAVKSLHRRSGGSYIGDVLREACFMAAGGCHPSLVAFRTVARNPGTMDYSVVMDYVGPSLRAVMGDRGDQPFSEAEVRRIMRQVLAGAEVMHGHGIVHRDIKPENILVGDGGAVKICNYGAAKSMAEKDTPCRFGGTISYMAPEVLVKNADHDKLVDLWSLGCVMAELLTGKLLFAGKDESNHLFKIFDVLGVPCKRVWQAMKPQAHDDKVQVWRARQLRARHRNQLRALFPEEMLSSNGFQVLKGLLTCDPEKRLTAASALQCPWFTENVDDAPVSGRVTVTKIVAMASKSRSLAISFVGYVLRFLRPKALVQ
ncbi:putative cyclin-dependent kinase F-2 [Dichanthelium oligosanthes]|uniref:[RNA-polymerase]-subunit kinase n=1 Tax=Dichanthelium oligosanthes TaxID=888268 RepID=A0A1E5VHH9_9POAL|nr:putative cyclin-dependent kinase F-2 [Dichanthelium oligosanthes]